MLIEENDLSFCVFFLLEKYTLALVTTYDINEQW